MTTFKDRWETNADGEQFVFTIEMQRRLADAGLPIEPESLAQLGEVPATPSSDTSSSSSDDKRGSQSKKSAAADDDVAAPATIQIDPMTGKYIGRVKWYNMRKGYGFLVRGGGEEIFFHKSSTVDEVDNLPEGQWILYDVEETRKGPEATDVEPYKGDVSLIDME